MDQGNLNIAVESLERRRLLAAQFVSAIDFENDYEIGPPSWAVAGDTLFFASDDGVHGVELWKSDGTAAGTAMVKDINPGASGSDPSSLYAFNGAVYFSAGYRLWKSDGTESGTVVIADVDAGNFADVNGVLFFSGWDAEHGSELWKSDGTTGGTQLVKDIIPGRVTRADQRWDPDTGISYWEYYDGGPYWSAPTNLTNVNGLLYFTAYDGAVEVARGSNSAEFNRELWKSDGTAGGTVRVKDILAGDLSSNPQQLVMVDQTLYFTASDADGGVELWKSNGTAAGTVRVKDDLQSFYGAAPSLINAIGTLFFIHHAEGGPLELWKTSGAAAVRVKELAAAGVYAQVDAMSAVGERVLISVREGTGINPVGSLWTSDSTSAGTTRLMSRYAYELTGDGDNVYVITADDRPGHYQLWRTDGTTAGTVLVSSAGPVNANFPPANLTNVAGTLFFTTIDPVHDQGLWIFPTAVHASLSAGGTLSVRGTDLGDEIVLSVSGDAIQVQHDRQVIDSMPLAQVSRIEINAFGGDNVVDCSAVSIPAGISAHDGQDHISGSSAADTIDAGGGNDFVWANDGSDKIAGGDGDDTLSGGAQKDTLDGGLGNDRLNGNGGHDRLFGGPGADRLYGYDGNDQLDGGSSGDRLEGGAGLDSMFGQGGNDRFFAQDGEIDQVFGGSGEDTVSRRDTDDILTSVHGVVASIAGSNGSFP